MLYAHLHRLFVWGRHVRLLHHTLQTLVCASICVCICALVFGMHLILIVYPYLPLQVYNISFVLNLLLLCLIKSKTNIHLSLIAKFKKFQVLFVHSEV